MRLVGQPLGAPAHHVRFDNGPESMDRAVNDCCRFNSTGSLFINPASPWQNSWIESFNGRLRGKLLNSWHFASLREAHVIIEDWRGDYNANRPHTADGDLTPTEFALQWTQRRRFGQGQELKPPVRFHCRRGCPTRILCQAAMAHMAELRFGSEGCRWGSNCPILRGCLIWVRPLARRGLSRPNRS
ncbi:Integrase, catalytic region [Mycobacterium intracellulare subsp. yongonense]|nr:Integrase, catalytic region [Mycobacterium intracellulare subsp. yongonense]